MALKDNLLKLVDEHGEGKQKAFSEKTGIPTSSLNTYLKKGNIPKLEHLLSLTSTLNINLHWLLTGEGSKYLGCSKSEDCIELANNFDLWCKSLIEAGTHTEKGIELDIRDAEKRFDRWMKKRDKLRLQDNPVSNRKIA